MFDKLLITVFLTIFLFSCSDNKNPDVLSKNEMTDVLIDMHIAEAKVNTIGLNADSTEILYNIMEKRILEEHGISKEQYLQSYNYYLRNMDQLESLYGMLVDSLSLKERIENSRSQ